MHPLLRRIETAVYRLRHGLPLSARGIAGPVATDVWVSQVSIYVAAAQWAKDADVVEVGCLAGDALSVLRRAGSPKSVRGFGDNPRLVAVGRRRFGLDLRVADLAHLPEDEPAADLLLAINSLQQVDDPDTTLDWIARHRRPGGRVVVSVPPVVDEGTMAMHRAIPSCRTHRFVWEWELRMRERFPKIIIFRHLPPAGAHLDFASREPSAHRPEDFAFEQIAPAELDELAGIGVIFLAEDDA